MRDFKFPTINSEHDIYFIEFDFFDIPPVTITTVEIRSAIRDKSFGGITDKVANSFEYDTRAEKLEDTITLPLKTAITEDTTANFDESSLKMSSGIAQAVQSIGTGGLLDAIGDMTMSQIRQASAVPEEIRRGLDATSQTAINERMQVFYLGPNRRGYTFEFQLVAKNLKDAKMMRAISRRFQYHASPGVTNTGTVWEYPNMTSFKFMRNVYGRIEESDDPSKRQGTPTLEKINTLFESKKCFIENVSVTHGDDRYMQFTDGNEYETGIMTIAVTLKEVDYFLQKDFDDFSDEETDETEPDPGRRARRPR